MITLSEIISEGNLSPSISADIIDPHIETAELELIHLIGNDVYTLIKSYENDVDDSKVMQFRDVKKGFLNLVLSYAVHSLNIDTAGNGLIRSKGWDSTRSELLSRSEIENLSEHFRSIALKFLQPYIINEVGTEDDPADEVNTGEFYLGAI
jgi:hypothetical protein